MGYLRGEGVAPGPVTPGADNAAELLAGTSDTLPDVTGDVAEALAAALDKDGKVDLLVRCSNDGSRDLAKSARRFLHALRRRGADVPQVRVRGTVADPGVSPRDLHADARAYTTAPFGNGIRIVLFRFRGSTDRGLHAAMANLSDEHGLRELRLYRSGAKVFRAMVAESSTQLAGATISFGRALHLVQQAVATTQRAGKLVPEHLSTLRSLLGPDRPVSEDHPADRLTPSEVPADEKLFALWERPELRTWITAEETLTELTASVGEALETTLVINEQQRLRRLGEILDRAVAQELDGGKRERWAQRLLDAAWVMHENQRVDEAAQLLAIREQLRRTEAPTELAFFRQLVGRLLLGRLPPELAADLIPGLPSDGPTPEASETANAEPGGVLWTPGSSTEPAQGGKGGLIIPGGRMEVSPDPEPDPK